MNCTIEKIGVTQLSHIPVEMWEVEIAIQKTKHTKKSQGEEGAQIWSIKIIPKTTMLIAGML